MRKQHFRGTVWPRPELADKGIYRYVVVGMIFTDKPLDGLSDNQIVLDGHAAGMAEALETITQKEANIKVGDATDVLLNLKYLCNGDLIAEIADDPT